MKILLTGASGFLGKHILKEFSFSNEVITVSRTSADLNVDLSRNIPVLPKVDLVIHCAGKAHSVPKTDLEKQAFFDVNYTGTVNLLEGLDQSQTLPRSFVFISTVAVYGCESGILINEESPLLANDPYGQSKILAENLVKKWCEKRKIIYSILRLPLLVGESPPGNLHSMINGIKKGYYFNIGNGTAKKSMVLAGDVAKIIPFLSDVGGIFNLTDGHHPSFADLSSTIAQQLNKKKPRNMPIWIAAILAMLGNLAGDRSPINNRKLAKMTSDLTFDDTRARTKLDWNPNSVLCEFKVTDSRI